MKKLKVIGLISILSLICFAVVFVASIAGLIGAALLDSQKSKGSDTPIPCTITGTKSGKQLNLTLHYDGMKVSSIKGEMTSHAAFQAASKKGKGKTPMEIPKKGAKLSAQTFMAYTAVTAKASDQYKLLNGSGAKDDGIYRKVSGRYAIALGSYYGSKIGTKYEISFQQKDGSKRTIQAVLGDQKADNHTDAKHQYHKVDGSVVEFITAKGTSKNVAKTQKQINADFGELAGIDRNGGSDVALTGNIKGSDVSVTGSVDGMPLTASGSIKNGKINAAGFIGESPDNLGSGVYSGGKFAWPVPSTTKVTSPYGWRICPFHGREFHSGIDIPAPSGTPIVAAADGTVVQTGNNGSYGNSVTISHGSGLFTLYGHNSTVSVRNGQKVKKGQKIAGVGSTGNSTGPHLHFEVRKGSNSHSNHTSPWDYLKKVNGKTAIVLIDRCFLVKAA